MLLVEDDPVNQEVALELLRLAGLHGVVVGSGLQAIERLVSEPFDLVLMDVQMPEMDGLEATRIVRTLPGFDRLPIVAMTASAFGEDREACFKAGMDDHLAKPVDPALLFGTLLRWLPAGVGTTAAGLAPAAALARTSAPQPAAQPPGADTHAGSAGEERIAASPAPQSAGVAPSQLDRLEALLATGDFGADALYRSLAPALMAVEADAARAIQRSMARFDHEAALARLRAFRAAAGERAAEPDHADC